MSLILKTGNDPNFMLNSRGQNGLQFMISYFNSTEASYILEIPLQKNAYLGIAKLLLNSGLNANELDLISGEPIAFSVIRYDDIDLLSILIHYIDFEVRDKLNGETILMFAAKFGSKYCLRLLLKHLQDYDLDIYYLRQRNKFGLTALDLSRVSNIDNAKVLTKHLLSFNDSFQDLNSSTSAIINNARRHNFSSAALDTPSIAAARHALVSRRAAVYPQLQQQQHQPQYRQQPSSRFAALAGSLIAHNNNATGSGNPNLATASASNSLDLIDFDVLDPTCLAADNAGLYSIGGGVARRSAFGRQKYYLSGTANDSPLHSSDSEQTFDNPSNWKQNNSLSRSRSCAMLSVAGQTQNGAGVSSPSKDQLFVSANNNSKSITNFGHQQQMRRRLHASHADLTGASTNQLFDWPATPSNRRQQQHHQQLKI